MDPVSAIGLASSVAGLADFTAQVLAKLYTYYGDVKAAPKQSAELREELGSLVGLLKAAEETLKNEPKGVLSMKKSLENIITPINEMLGEMKKRCEEKQTSGLRRLKWPFGKEDNERYMLRIAGYKTTLILALDLESRYIP